MARSAIAIHGGEPNLPQQSQEQAKPPLQVGVDALLAGSSAPEAVVPELETGPFFNSGRGTVELEASIMDGRCGAVSGVSTVKNPVSLPRRVMDKPPHSYQGETNSPTNRDVNTCDNGNGSDKNEKGILGFAYTVAEKMIVANIALISFWGFSNRSDKLLIISDIWMQALGTGVGISTIISIILAGFASHFKESEESPHHLGFQLFSIALLFEVVWFYAASCLILRVCLRLPNWAVWTVGFICSILILLTWIYMFVIKRFEKMRRRLRGPSLPIWIKPGRPQVQTELGRSTKGE